MLVAGPVVGDPGALEGVLDVGQGDPALLLGRDDQGGRLQGVEGVAGVAVGPVDQVGQGVVVEGQALAAEAPLGVGQGPGDDRLQLP